MTVMFSKQAPVEGAFQWARRIANGDSEAVLDEITASIVDDLDYLWLLATSSARLTANLIWVQAFVNGEQPQVAGNRLVVETQAETRDDVTGEYDPDITRCLQVVTALLNQDNEMAKDLIVSHAAARRLTGLLGIAQTGLALSATVMQRMPWMMES
jgi:hypothetical protein